MGEECLNALSLACIHRYIFLDYDKIIYIYASKYPRRMLLINPPNENQTVETFNAIYALIVIRSLLKDQNYF